VRAWSLRSVAVGALLALSMLGPVARGGAPDDVSVQYRLLTEFEGTEQAGGRIVVAVTNHSSRALAKVTLRLADPGVGRITGPVQEAMTLAAGETRQVEGDFVIDVMWVHSARPIDWIVVYAEPEGFAKQVMVRGEALPGQSMDADASTLTSR
jgi:hypothetical protein